MSAWRENSRCRGCGHREHGGYSRFDTLCPKCGLSARWSWQVWETVVERPVGWLRRRWEQRPSDEPFETDKPRGGFVW